MSIETPIKYKPKYKPVHDYVTGELNLDSLLSLIVSTFNPKPTKLEDLSEDILYELYNIASKNRYEGNYVDYIIVLNRVINDN
jgi:hypothetical protein